MKFRLLSIAMLIVLFSCAPKVAVGAMQPNPVQVPPKIDSPDNSSSTVTPAGAVAVDLEAAKVLYENKCNKCHGLYKSNDFSAEEWKPIMKRMQIKAKIDDQQREEIYAYILSGMQ